jgi:hypothetical protein
MTMTITELERSLRAQCLSGMTATLESRALLQVAQQQMDFIEAFSALVQDELDRRRSRLIERRFALSGLSERKDLKDFARHREKPYREGARALGSATRLHGCLSRGPRSRRGHQPGPRTR